MPIVLSRRNSFERKHKKIQNCFTSLAEKAVWETRSQPFFAKYSSNTN